jgi:ABC-type multidrug transport system fused ATPase/permease subunit
VTQLKGRIHLVLNVVRRALSFMKPRERAKFSLFLSFRAFVALLDLIGILAIGFLATSMALIITEGNQVDRSVEVGPFLIPTVNFESLPIIAAAVLTLFITKAILSILLTRQLAYFLAGIEARSARVIAKNAFGRGLEGARLNSREEIHFVVQNGSPSAFHNVLNSVGTLAAEGFLFILVLGAFALVNPLVAAGAILYFGFIGLVIQFFIGRMMEQTGIRLANSSVDANAGLSDLGEVQREAEILGRQDFFFDKIYIARKKASGSSATQFVLTGMPRYIVEAALIIAIAVFIIVQAYSGDIVSSAATIGIFLSGGLRLTSSLLPLQSALLIIKQAIPSANKALDLLLVSETNERIEEKSAGQDQTTGPLSVKIRDLSFSYQGSTSETLSRLNVDISAGSQVAFIGVSGAGKSTIADLILGLLVPTSGQILVDGENPTELIHAKPGLLGYVPQKPGLVSGTIEQNIALGVDSSEIDEGSISGAVRDSHLSELIGNLPEGLKTNIGKRKDELSGGQIQRIGLARALYTNPKLLVMDEATSALDAESENEINKALDEMRGKVTVILIAHRLNTIQRSDKVFLVEDGQITDSGSFQELVKKNDVVRNLAELMAIDK